MTDLSRLAELGPEELEFLRRRLQKSARKAESRILPIRRLSREADAFPLSYAQRRLWFADRLEPGNPTYNVGILTRLTGAFDRGLFLRAVGEVFRRHEILRTTFTWRGQEPMQVISPEARIAARIGLPVVDLEALPDGRREAEAERQAAAAALGPFALDRGPLMRLTLFRLAAGDHLLLVAFHHIVSDGWAFGIFVRELAAVYEAFHRGSPSPLPELPVQYVDFAQWQREWLAGGVSAQQLAYWQERLAGLPPALELPTDRPRGPVLGSRGRREHRTVPADLEQGLARLAESCGATLFMVLLAGFQALLHRYTGEADFALGSPVANRGRKEIEGLMGFFANTLVLRADLAGAPTFRQLVARARDTALGAFAAQDLPFERLVEELRPERDLSHQPVFQVMFALQNFELQARALPGLALEPVDWELGRSHFDLTLFFTPEERRLLTTLRYNLDLFDGATAARILGHLTALLAGAVRDADRPVADYELFDEAERRQLAQWSTGAGRQLRIRGFRVDPEAVAARLRRQPGVGEAAVVARPDPAGRPRLVAYVAGDWQLPASRELRARLQAELPDYSVPAAFVRLAALPLAPGGDVDVAALPAPEEDAAGEAAEGPVCTGHRPRPAGLRFRRRVAPRTPTEAALAAVFADVLGVAEVGVHDGFFELGGHSLLGTVLMTRVRDAFGVDLPVLRLFEAPTVEELATLLDAGRAAPAPAAGLDAIVPVWPPDAEAAVAALSDAEVSAMLAELLAGGAAPA